MRRIKTKGNLSSDNCNYYFPFLLFQFKLSMQVMEGLMDSAFSELCVDPIAYTVLLIVPFSLGPKLTVSLTVSDLLVYCMHIMTSKTKIWEFYSYYYLLM